MVSPRGKTEKNLIPWFRKHMDDMIFQTIIPYQKKANTGCQYDEQTGCVDKYKRR